MYLAPARGATTCDAQDHPKWSGTPCGQYISQKTMCESNKATSGVSSFAALRICVRERSFAALRMTKRDSLFFEMYCPLRVPGWHLCSTLPCDTIFSP